MMMMVIGLVSRRLRDGLLTATTSRAANFNGGGGAAETLWRRYFATSSSRKRAPNLRKINPKVPPQEAALLAESLYNLIKHHGSLSVSNTWNHAKEAGISGLNSKTHMKLMLKWMRGRNMLKQFCNHVGSSKKFLLTTLPEEPQLNQSNNFMELKTNPKRPSTKRTKMTC